MKTEAVKCDGCGADLTYTSNCVDYRLALISEPLHVRDPMLPVTAMLIYPPVDRTHHFCGLACLSFWINQNQKTRAAS